MRPLSELLDDCEPAWPLVEEWIGGAAIDVEVLPTDRITERPPSMQRK